MSILIQGMEMPKNCTGCPICCGLPYQHRDEKGRRPDCPLIEIPTPHGRLGDLDKMKNQIMSSDNSLQMDEIRKIICEWIDGVDTVIEAEGSEK